MICCCIAWILMQAHAIRCRKSLAIDTLEAQKIWKNSGWQNSTGIRDTGRWNNPTILSRTTPIPLRLLQRQCSPSMPQQPPLILPRPQKIPPWMLQPPQTPQRLPHQSPTILRPPHPPWVKNSNQNEPWKYYQESYEPELSLRCLAQICITSSLSGIPFQFTSICCFKLVRKK